MPEMEANYPKLLLVSCEVAGSLGFLGVLKNLAARNWLSRIVVDECHLAVTWSSFRPCMEQLVGLRSIRVPLILLTASMPPFMETKLKITFSSNFRTIRASTVRPEISYRVRRVSPMESVEDHVIKLIMELLYEETVRIVRDRHGIDMTT